MDDPKGAHGGIAAAWMVAMLMAFSSSIEAGLLVLIGYLGQWLKSAKRFPTVLAQVLILASCIGVYALLHRPATVPPSEQWVTAAATWALAALGVASATAGTRGAPKTDSM